MITYHHATDTKGHIVHIDDVTKENRSYHYYCVGCGGEMTAVLGDKREHHFRHKEAHCSWESYLHKLGKTKLKQKFDTQKEFVIKYYVEYRCNISDECKLGHIFKDNKCNIRRELIKRDLKKEFDTCEEEVTYKGYRADLMLSSKEHPEREPIFLEISVTHDCNPEKLKSGIKIIELKITEENDVLHPLVEKYALFGSANHEYPYDSKALPPIRFFNFERTFDISRPLERFWITKDEKGILHGHCEQDSLNCRNILCNHQEDSMYQITIPSEVIIHKRKPNVFEFGMMKAINAGIDIRHCGICDKIYQHCLLINVEEENKDTGEKRIVQKLVRTCIILYINKKNQFVQAHGCSHYSKNRYYISKVLRDFRNLPYWEWKKE